VPSVRSILSHHPPIQCEGPATKSGRMVMGGWGSDTLRCLFTHHPWKYGYSYREWKSGARTSVMIITLIHPLVGISIFPEPALAIWSERLANPPSMFVTVSSMVWYQARVAINPLCCYQCKTPNFLKTSQKSKRIHLTSRITLIAVSAQLLLPHR